jgi:hypothetical protein
MEHLLASEVERVLAAPAITGALEGVLYMMYWRDEPAGSVLPALRRPHRPVRQKAGNVSTNLLDMRGARQRFARWGSGYQYHIGDLSAASCPGHAPAKVSPKYQRWASGCSPTHLRCSPAQASVYFWATAWGPDAYNIWSDFGACSLAFEEYLLIGVGSELFPHVLLERGGGQPLRASLHYRRRIAIGCR